MNKKNLIKILIGNIILAFNVSQFVIPNKFISGGATGVALILQHILGTDISLILLIINLITFTIGTIVLGKVFAFSTIISSFTYPIMLKIFRMIHLYEYLHINIIVIASIAGLLTGISLCLILNSKASTGGLDVFSLILKKKMSVPTEITVNSIDILVLTAQVTFSQLTEIGYGIYIVLLTAITMKYINSRKNNK